MRVSAKVSNDNMPTAVIIQKNRLAQKALLQNMQNGWSQHPKIRVQYNSGLANKNGANTTYSSNEPTLSSIDFQVLHSSKRKQVNQGLKLS